jgi:MFS family permease
MSLVPRLPRRAWQVLGASTFSAIGTGFVMPFTIVYLHEIRGISLATAGLAMATMPVAALASSFGSGPLIDRFGPRRVLVGMLVIASLGSLTLIAVRHPWQAFVAAGLLGIGISSSWVGLQPTLASIVPATQRADSFAVQFALLNAGFGIGGLAGGLIVDLDKPRTFEALYAFDAASFLAFALVMALLHDVGAPLPAVAAAGSAEGYRAVIRDHVFARVWTLNTLFVAVGQVQLDTAFPAYVILFAKQSPSVVGAAFAANTFTIVLFQFVVSRWVKGRRRTRGLMVQAGFWAAAWTLTLAAGELAWGNAAPVAFVAAAVLLAFGEMLHAPIVPAIVNDLAPEELRGRYNAANAVSWQTARIVGAPVAGIFLGAGLAAPLLLVFVGACGLAALLAVDLERRLPPAANGLVAPVTPLGEEREPAVDDDRLPADHVRAG